MSRSPARTADQEEARRLTQWIERAARIARRDPEYARAHGISAGNASLFEPSSGHTTSADWLRGAARYMTLETIAPLGDDLTVSLPSLAA